MLATTPKLTVAQRKRLDALVDIGPPDSENEAKITGWNDALGGPVVRFPRGTSYTITRDGGLEAT